jgi:putative ribosome biogenesis GTPase RsgA
MIVQSVDTMKFTFILKTLARDNNAVFFTGASGTGKSVIIDNYISSAKEF